MSYRQHRESCGCNACPGGSSGPKVRSNGTVAAIALRPTEARSKNEMGSRQASRGGLAIDVQPGALEPSVSIPVGNGVLPEGYDSGRGAFKEARCHGPVVDLREDAFVLQCSEEALRQQEAGGRGCESVEDLRRPMLAMILARDSLVEFGLTRVLLPLHSGIGVQFERAVYGRIFRAEDVSSAPGLSFGIELASSVDPAALSATYVAISVGLEDECAPGLFACFRCRQGITLNGSAWTFPGLSVDRLHASAVHELTHAASAAAAIDRGRRNAERWLPVWIAEGVSEALERFVRAPGVVRDPLFAPDDREPSSVPLDWSQKLEEAYPEIPVGPRDAEVAPIPWLAYRKAEFFQWLGWQVDSRRPGSFARPFFEALADLLPPGVRGPDLLDRDVYIAVDGAIRRAAHQFDADIGGLSLTYVAAAEYWTGLPRYGRAGYWVPVVAQNRGIQVHEGTEVSAMRPVVCSPYAAGGALDSLTTKRLYFAVQDGVDRVRVSCEALGDEEALPDDLFMMVSSGSSIPSQVFLASQPVDTVTGAFDLGMVGGLARHGVLVRICYANFAQQGPGGQLKQLELSVRVEAIDEIQLAGSEMLGVTNAGTGRAPDAVRFRSCIPVGRLLCLANRGGSEGREWTSARVVVFGELPSMVDWTATYGMTYSTTLADFPVGGVALHFNRIAPPLGELDFEPWVEADGNIYVKNSVDETTFVNFSVFIVGDEGVARMVGRRRTSVHWCGVAGTSKEAVPPEGAVQSRLDCAAAIQAAPENSC